MSRHDLSVRLGVFSAILSVFAFNSCTEKKSKMVSEHAESSSFHCECCGEEHSLDDLQLGFKYPDAYMDLSEEERETWVFDNPKRPTLASWGGAHFIRGVIEVPVKGRAVPFGFGVWVKVPEDVIRSLKREDAQPGRGELNTRIAGYPETHGLPVKIIVDDPQMQPMLQVLDEKHPLGLEARDGMPLAKCMDLLIGYSHQSAYNLTTAVYDVKTFQTPHFASLEADGWTLKEALSLRPPVKTMSKTAENEPPHLFEAVKLYFLIEYEEEGETLTGGERMWVQIDLIGDGIYGGSLQNHPKLSKKLKLESRIWFGPEHILDIIYLNGTKASDNETRN